MFTSIKWELYERRPGVWLKVDYEWMTTSVVRDSLNSWLEKELDNAGVWCKEHSCGKRMSYHMFQFDTEAQRTMFLLRWS
jgi:hypothetical protein